MFFGAHCTGGKFRLPVGASVPGVSPVPIHFRSDKSRNNSATQLEEGDVRLRGTSQSGVSSAASEFHPFLQSNTPTLYYRLTLSMPARWVRLGAVTSVVLLVLVFAFVLLQDWRWEAMYPNVTRDGLPIPARDLFSCVRPYDADMPHCCVRNSLGDRDCHEVTHWAETEHWSYCGERFESVMLCCFYQV